MLYCTKKRARRRLVAHGAAAKRRTVVAVGNASNGALAKHHVVLRQRARLVAENVFDLAQLLVEGRRAGQRRRVGLFMVHVEVVVDEDDGLKIPERRRASALSTAWSRGRRGAASAAQKATTEGRT